MELGQRMIVILDLGQRTIMNLGIIREKAKFVPILKKRKEARK